MADDLHPRPSAHFTPPWSTVKNIAAKDLDDNCIGQKILWWDSGYLWDVEGVLRGYHRFPNSPVRVFLKVGDSDCHFSIHDLDPDHDVSVFYNFDGETAGNPEYVRGIGVLLLWGVITGLIALAVVVTLWKWS